MNSAIIVMTLLGCGQTGDACEYIRTVEAPFSSLAECETRIEAELLKTGADGYPDVIAVCEPRRNRVVDVPDLPGPSDPGEIAGAPRVIAMPEDIRPRNPVTWVAGKTRKLIGGLNTAVSSVWQGLTRRGSRDEEPIVLGRFKSEDG